MSLCPTHLHNGVQLGLVLPRDVEDHVAVGPVNGSQQYVESSENGPRF